MGNALRLLYGKCFQPSTTGDSDSVGPPYTTTAPAVSALAHDLFNFEITSQVPEALSQHVVSSREAQVTWYGKLLQSWKEAKPPPKTPEEVARLIVETLSRHQKADVEGLLEFYGLPHPSILAEISTGVPTRLPEFVFQGGTLPEFVFQGGTRLPEGVEFEMHTLPVDGNTVPDGDGLNVYVNTDDPRESPNIPRAVLMAVVRRSKARAKKNYARADELRQKIIESGYQVIDLQNEEILARKYRIRLRGIDAPEMSMPFGKEAKEELVKLVHGKCLRVLVYGEDQYGRCVADIYCNGIFVQEVMLKKGLAWHYVACDQRVEFATWQKEARTKKTGLWVQSNPEKPWEWRKKNKREAEISTGVPTRLPEFVFQGGTLPEFVFQGGTRLPEGVEFEMHTLPVDGNTVPDGDGLNVYVNTDDPRESPNIPRAVLMAVVRRSKARAKKNYARADELRQKIIESGYQVIDLQNEEILARKYRIRLRGIDAPEMSMPFGKEAKEELVKLVHGKCLRVLVYGEDHYGRCVADIYCNSIFVQEVMLKKGLAWHYVACDQRVEFATWQKEARTKKTGLWVQSNPEKPWEWRKKNKQEGR
ncbi:hypothetical protein ES319_A10G264600v1 [Gossypium barbadense]|nr:hypothetical protein ES319_A10G264600v1 [Gossypium barbadense]